LWECAGDWVKKHNLCLLVTHHPPDWLTSEARNYLDHEIAPSERFAMHLFGHMHESFTEYIRRNSAYVRRYCQARSLFGLKTWGSEKLTRSHGYIFGQLQFDENLGHCTLRYWPRKAEEDSSGGWHFKPDPGFH